MTTHEQIAKNLTDICYGIAKLGWLPQHYKEMAERQLIYERRAEENRLKRRRLYDILTMRDAGVSWDEISRITGLKPSYLRVLHTYARGYIRSALIME